MSKGIVTDYSEICVICGRPSEAEHHLVFGTSGLGKRIRLAEGRRICTNNRCGSGRRRGKADYS